jgi:dUTP pyrophosphatase
MSADTNDLAMALDAIDYHRDAIHRLRHQARIPDAGDAWRRSCIRVALQHRANLHRARKELAGMLGRRHMPWATLAIASALGVAEPTGAMIVRYRLLREDARVPSYGSAEASGLDLHACGHTSLWHGETRLIQTGLAIELPAGFEAQVRPRSGISKRGLLVHVGTIDADYRGEIGLVVTNVGQTCQVVDDGDRIAQLVIAPVVRATLERAEVLSETVRGTGGFGSTGR